jgi:hypothetical protein
MKFNFFSLLTFFLILSCAKDESDVSTVVINELMAVNSHTAKDQNNQYDDWIELYNNSGNEVDLTDFYLTDSRSNLQMWKFPAGAAIAGKSFLIVWADKDTLQPGLHTNFKLSSSGEKVYLVAPDLEIWDKVEYDEQVNEISYSRSPNGVGEFKWQSPTFNVKNK